MAKIENQVKYHKLSSKKFLIPISFLIILCIIILIFKTFFTNPVGLDQKFYEDHLYIYETIMTAYEEERALTSFEYSKIESIFNDVENQKSIFMESLDNKSEEEIETQMRLSELSHDVEMMFMNYDFATDEFLDEDDRKTELAEFVQQQKVAKAALGLK